MGQIDYLIRVALTVAELWSDDQRAQVYAAIGGGPWEYQRNVHRMTGGDVGALAKMPCPRAARVLLAAATP